MLRQRLEQAIDRVADAAPLGRLGHAQPAVIDCQRGIRRDHIDMVGLDGHTVGGLGDRHGAVLTQHVRQPAFAGGVEMHHNQEGHAAVGRHRLEQADQRLDAASRGAATYDGERSGCGAARNFGRAWLLIPMIAARGSRRPTRRFLFAGALGTGP